MYPNLKLQIFKFDVHQNRIAKTLGINESVLSKIIRGYREPTQAQRKRLAAFLNVDENWLFEKYEGSHQDPSIKPGLSPSHPEGDFT